MTCKCRFFVVYVEYKLERQCQVFYSDNGTEFMNGQMSDYIKENGIILGQLFPLHQNWIYRNNKHFLLDVCKTMLVDLNIDNIMISTANSHQQGLPTKAMKNTPYELFSTENQFTCKFGS